MELRLKPHYKNLFPLGGFIIKGPTAKEWLQEIQAAKLELSQTEVYPLPGTVADTVWGCLVVFNFEKKKIDIGKNAYCQLAHNCLFIPEKTFIYPRLSQDDVKKLFAGKSHFMHPVIGLIELAEVVNWTEVLQAPAEELRQIKKATTPTFIPNQVKSFQIKAVAPEEALQDFAEKNFPKHEKFHDKPLNPFEKAKLFFYRQLFSKIPETNGEQQTQKKPLLTQFEKLRNFFSGKRSNWPENLQKDYDELERRNEKHLDRLLEMLKKNPAEALKYALPLDNDGSGRGGIEGSFNLEKRWFDFSLFGEGFRNGGGSASLQMDSYNRLYQQYTETAKELIKQKDYSKAAFIYLKLLKDYHKAAETLENGKLYSEAAAVYLKYCKDKEKAALCFEKGNLIDNAIELHKELNNDEKVGDLYRVLNKRKEAFFYYQKVADNYTQNHQYLKASFLYKSKMENEQEAQEILLKGWRLGRDSFNCLNNYFANFRSVKHLGETIQHIYQQDVKEANREVFLRVIQHEYLRHHELSQDIRDIAYEIITEEVKRNPSIVSELRTFNKEDKQLVKDTMRFKVNTKKTN